MADRMKLSLTTKLVMTPHLQLAIKLLATPSHALAALVAGAMADRPGLLEELPPDVRDPSDDLEIARAADEGRPPWFFLDDSPFAAVAAAPLIPVLPIGLFSAPTPPRVAPDDADVWMFGDPVEVRANGRASPRYQIVPGASKDHAREAQWLLFALRQRSRTFERVVGALVAAQPAIAGSVDGADVAATPIRAIAEAIEMHESTITRAASVCTFRTRHGVFALVTDKRGISVRRI